MSEIRILYIDDSPLDRALVKAELSQLNGYKLTLVSDKKSLLKELRSVHHFDIVLSDFNILGLTGLQVIDVVKSERPDVPVVIVTGTGSEETAVAAMKLGAADYVIKSPSHIIRLDLTIKSVVDRQKLLREKEQARLELYRFFDLSQDCLVVFDKKGEIVSKNPAAQRMFESLMSEAAGSRASIFKLLRPAAAKTIKANMAEIVKDGDVLTCVLQTNEALGDLWLELNATWMAMTNKFYGVFRDITERRLQEMKRQEAAVCKALLSLLNKKEMDVLRIVVDGIPNKAIAKRLDISEKTVERHRSNAMKKLQLKSLPELVRMMMIADSISD